MSGSAPEGALAKRRRESTAREINRCAQTLADERGLDGFTMEDLAEAVGVSRRTLFNYVPSKIDAVLGSDLPSEPESEPFTTFRLGGPSGHLVSDIREVGASVLRLNEHDSEEVARLRRLLRSDPRLAKAVHDRLEKVVKLLAEAIVEREGSDFEPFAARVLAHVTLCIFGMSVDEFIADSSVSAADHYLRVFDTAVDLFG
ncbi:TetR/AcrR family transcriptional regulator [Streptomyces sp. TP-A0874]|uniref:TetR/AcrR family transcriptional regulator n=1 Tax=Streptomyces sp. TP-A0874 TaxID=549819 RepID=UPI001479BE7B|nr:TetR/AcrR family transcriptional regulator [Streptomyces sp. TP-A0874]